MYKSLWNKLFATKINHFNFEGSMVMHSPHNPFGHNNNIHSLRYWKYPLRKDSMDVKPNDGVIYILMTIKVVWVIDEITEPSVNKQLVCIN